MHSLSRQGSASCWLVATIAIAAGCSNLDSEVVPDVVEAHVAVDRSAPGELAMVDIVLRLVAGSRADRRVELWDAALMELMPERPGINLNVAFPDGPVDLEPDDQRMVSLVNVGTTNADLTPGCGRAFDVFVTIRYLDDGNGFTDVDRERVIIGCD